MQFGTVFLYLECAWEEILQKDPSAANDLRILAPKESKSACVHSTDLYPAHTLAALPHVTPEAVTATTLAFLRMPPTERGRSWAVATDYLSIDKLFRALKTGPYRYLREPVWKRFLAEYFPFILIFLGVALLFLWQFENTKRLLEKRTLEVRRLAQKEAEQERRLLFLERNTMVSQLSSMLAHELHQPLAAIRLYARGLVKLLARTNPSPEVTEAADAIADEATRAKEIVERVRAYARNRRAERKETPLSEILQNAEKTGRRRFMPWPFNKKREKCREDLEKFLKEIRWKHWISCRTRHHAVAQAMSTSEDVFPSATGSTVATNHCTAISTGNRQRIIPSLPCSPRWDNPWRESRSRQN